MYIHTELLMCVFCCPCHSVRTVHVSRLVLSFLPTVCLLLFVSADERMLQRPDEGLSPTWTPSPSSPPPLTLPPLPRPSEPLASPSHHEPAVSRAPKAAGGVSHGRRPAHLALPAGWKPGEWVRVQIKLPWFSPTWESTPCNYHAAKRWFIIREWSCGSGQRDALIQPARTENINYQLVFPSISLWSEFL